MRYVFVKNSQNFPLYSQVVRTTREFPSECSIMSAPETDISSQVSLIISKPFPTHNLECINSSIVRYKNQV